MQIYLEEFMKDLINSSLDVNILVRKSDTTEKRLINCAVEAIEYYWPIKPRIPTKSIYLWLIGLSLLDGLHTNPNYTKSKRHGENGNISNKVDDEVPWADGLSSTNPSRIKCESCCNHCNISNRIGNGISLTKEIQLHYCNSIHNKSEL